MRLTDLLKEKYGSKGKYELPSNHKAGMKVPTGGSCCANCRWWNAKKEQCINEYYIQWNDGSGKIPEKANEYCTDWWEPKKD